MNENYAVGQEINHAPILYIRNNMMPEFRITISNSVIIKRESN
jgi:hypothetical protein